MIDTFDSYSAGPDDPANGMFAITPNDDADLAQITRAVIATGSGVVAVVMRDGSTGTLPLPAEQIMPYRIRRVLESGTTATGIVGLI